MRELLDTRYEHQKIEQEIYEMWEKSGYFNPDKLPHKQYPKSAKRYTIIMPPPNANGLLHIGHAVFVTLQDIMIRFARMRGKKALWLPGADHAGFETQVVFDKKLDKEGRNRFAIPREELWQEIFNFTQENKRHMENQLRKLGASCDWSREKFTLDPDIVKEAQSTFVKLYEDGLAYRDMRVVNWCPKHKTALSDLEVKYVEREDPLYFIKYGPLVAATVRPETKFGDTALAVNPNDKRYKKYIGEELGIQDVLGKIKLRVIADGAIDPAFGTGVVKVTPAHDPADFDIWKRHKDEIPGLKQVIDEGGRLTGEVGEYKGLKVHEARQKVVDALQNLGLMVKTEPGYKHQVATCYKCGNVLEPLPKAQWFVKMEPLAKKATHAVKKKKIVFYPDRAKKVYFHWLKNIRDWNISRQIVWGIRIPAWFCKAMETAECRAHGGVIVSRETPAACPYCSSAAIEQDQDVFDTWFSSGQWPFLTLGYPKGADYKKFYPTDVLETAYDILFFWVARMIMLGLYRTGKVPFKAVYLHGLVRDQDRQKMSKSKGNVIDPLSVAEMYGTDAVRMALVVGNTAGNDIIISEDKIRGYRNFATKIWNASRFVFMQHKEEFDNVKPKLSADDKKNLLELKKVKAKVAKSLERLDFHHAGEEIYHYFWHTFADKIIEAAKPRMQGADMRDAAAAYHTLTTILGESLKMVHPFMPFVTEAIYQKLHPGEFLMIQKW